jgi:hypothetical protein
MLEGVKFLRRRLVRGGQFDPAEVAGRVFCDMRHLQSITPSRFPSKLTIDANWPETGFEEMTDDVLEADFWCGTLRQSMVCMFTLRMVRFHGGVVL